MLVCSDAIARGMDLDAVDVVVHYDMPPLLSTYAHRAGRTARAGRQGHSVTLCTPDQVRHMKHMMPSAVDLHELHLEHPDTLRPQYEAALEALAQNPLFTPPMM